MSVAGLKFSADRADRLGGPLETKSGSYIFYGDPASFHDWEFRTRLRIKLFEQEIKDRKKKEEDAEEDEYMIFPDLSGETRHDKKDTTPKSSKSSGASRPPDRSVLVNKIIEGLRGDAFSIARDVGIDVITAPGGLDLLVQRLRAHVFPRAREEAKELFRAGQKQGGPLSRQPGEPMLSYTQRRRRWWKMLQELDPSISFSDGLRTELLLELSGLSRQEILVVRACATTKDFEGMCAVLVEQYGGLHLREGARSWSGRGSTPYQPSKGKGKYPSNGKGYGFRRTAHVAYPEEDYGYEDYENTPWNAEEVEDQTPFVGLLGELEEEHYEYADEVPDVDWSIEADEVEAIALNALEELGEAEKRQIGDAIQLQLAAFAAFGKAKGKGKGKSPGKGKGKVVRSNLTIEQRRQKLAKIKAKSKCLRCGGQGHWAGDPACKFPGSKGGQPSQC